MCSAGSRATTDASRANAWPGWNAAMTLFGGSCRPTDTKRIAGVLWPPSLMIVTARRISSALSGSSGWASAIAALVALRKFGGRAVGGMKHAEYAHHRRAAVLQAMRQPWRQVQARAR